MMIHLPTPIRELKEMKALSLIHIISRWAMGVILLLAAATVEAEEQRVIFATGEWPPFTSEALPEYGRATALVSAISGSCRD